jgi:acetyl-CoA C-acetyltransferase
MKRDDTVCLAAVRTPMGRFGGTLKDVASFDLGAAAISAALKKAGVAGNDVDDVIFGSCRQAGNGPNPARTASVRAGVPKHVPVVTVNMACPSGMRCTAMASQSLRLGEARIVVAGGMDSMSTIPYLLKNCRWEGFKMGNRELLDGWSDSIDPLIGQGMGETAENLADKYAISREDQDRYAAASHARAAAAWDAGHFDAEVIPVEVPGRGKEPPQDRLPKGRYRHGRQRVRHVRRSGGPCPVQSGGGRTQGAEAPLLDRCLRADGRGS